MSSAPRLALFLSRLPEIEDREELAAAVAEVSAPLGLPTVMAGAVYVQRAVTRARFYFGNWPADWMARYTAELLAADPLVGEARRRIEPFTWTELKGEGGLAPEMEAAFETGAQAGWTDGLAVPIHGPAGYTALVSFAGRDLRLAPLDRAVLRVVAFAAHERSREIDQSLGSGNGLLTPREREVVRWLGVGKTDWEVGRILGISQRTAHFHVEQIKRKLGVKTRAEALGVLALHPDA